MSEREAERAAIVKWLERWIEFTDGEPVNPQYVIDVLKRGQHLQEQTNDK